MKPPLLNAYATMMPRLQAEEALAAATVASLPYAKDRERKRILRDWERQVTPDDERPREDPRAALRQFTQASGIPSIVEKPRV